MKHCGLEMQIEIVNMIAGLVWRFGSVDVTDEMKMKVSQVNQVEMKREINRLV